MLDKHDLDEIDERIKDRTKLLPTKDDFFSKMDEVMGELQAIRQAQELQTDTISEHTDELEEHNMQIAKIKKHIALP